VPEPKRTDALQGAVRRGATRIIHAVRDAGLIVGITLVLIVGLEVVYRMQGAARRALFGSTTTVVDTAPAFPFDTIAWSADYRRDHVMEETLLWSPYVYVRNPTFTGTVMSVDSAGHRVTPQPEGSGPRVVDVWFLGGSTTFGWFQRDSFTIPAVAARELQSALAPGSRLRVTNFGAPGRVFTQEIIELMLQLRAGARPDAVVFYDGINDVMATVQNGIAGVPQNEANRVADFERGRQVVNQAAPDCGAPCPTPAPPSVGDRVRALGNYVRNLGRIGAAVARRLELVQRFRRDRPARLQELVSADSAAASLARVYAANVGLVEALASRYGFTALYVWQPVLLSTDKRLTPREAWLSGAAHGPAVERIRDVHIAVPPLLRMSVPALVGDRFIDATPVFAADTLEVFADLFGHTYERANPPIVAAFLPRLSEIVSRASRRPASAVRP